MNQFINTLHPAALVKVPCPEIPTVVQEEWQSVVNLIARLTNVRAALIMRVQAGQIRVLLSSETPRNPYHPGKPEPLANSGLYCEHVVRTGQPLSVPNALLSDEWRDNPDMKYQMKCYLGFPIHMPNGQIFGTICMLDDKENHFSPDIQDFLEKMRNLIESYLQVLFISVTDPLTGLYNRTYLDQMLPQAIRQASEKKLPLSALLLDVDRFKHINDSVGHLDGDRVLQRFANTLFTSLRDTDIAFRFGGDEFLVLLPNTSLTQAQEYSRQISDNLAHIRLHPLLHVTVSIGAAEYHTDESSDEWFMRIDHALYHNKFSRRSAP